MARVQKVILEIEENTGNVSCSTIARDVSADEMYAALLRFRDELDAEIAEFDHCPFHKPSH